jgi:hypothetical protein
MRGVDDELTITDEAGKVPPEQAAALGGWRRSPRTPHRCRARPRAQRRCRHKARASASRRPDSMPGVDQTFSTCSSVIFGGAPGGARRLARQGSAGRAGSAACPPSGGRTPAAGDLGVVGTGRASRTIHARKANCWELSPRATQRRRVSRSSPASHKLGLRSPCSLIYPIIPAIRELYQQ